MNTTINVFYGGFYLCPQHFQWWPGVDIVLPLIRIFVSAQYFKMEIRQIFAHSLMLTRPMLR